jgi:hypothetical protein
MDIDYKSKYLKYKYKYIKLNDQIGGRDLSAAKVYNPDEINFKISNRKTVFPSLKFNPGDKVKRIKGTLNLPLNKNNKPKEQDYVGIVGEVKFFKKSREFPPKSGIIIPDVYVVEFPDKKILEIPVSDLQKVSSKKKRFVTIISYDIYKDIIEVILYDQYEGKKISELILDTIEDSIYFKFRKEPVIILYIGANDKKHTIHQIYNINTTIKKYVFKNLVDRIINDPKKKSLKINNLIEKLTKLKNSID